jgi:hypothetical protein
MFIHYKRAGISDETIRQEAYFLWENAGKPEGKSEHFWNKAREKLGCGGSVMSSSSQEYYCNTCGAKAGSDARMGSLDVYLTCGCDKNKVWINDGRGGYFYSPAHPITAQEFEAKHK